MLLFWLKDTGQPDSQNIMKLYNEIILNQLFLFTAL